VGVVLQAAALDRGRVAIIQPLLVTAVIWAMPLGYFLTNQTITRRHILGAAIVVAGLAIFASFGDPAGGLDDAPGSAWLSAFVVLGTICICLLLFGRRGDLSARATVYGAIAGILYGVSATLMKPVVENLHTDGAASVLEGWEFWVMAIGGLGGFYIQQISLATGKLVTSVATVSVVNPVVSVMLGVLVLQERLDQPPAWHVVLAVVGLALALLGAVVIASVSEGASEVEATSDQSIAPPRPQTA
jgi:drug/metabolite transporter (DMT)-like permease